MKTIGFAYEAGSHGSHSGTEYYVSMQLLMPSIEGEDIQRVQRLDKFPVDFETYQKVRTGVRLAIEVTVLD